MAQSTIVYADLCSAAPQLPSAVAGSVARAAKESSASGQFDVTLRPLSDDDVRQAVAEYPGGHERLSRDTNLVLLDTGAILAYAPYRARLVLTTDPFVEVDRIAETLSTNVDFLRIRLHDALLLADNIITLGQAAFNAVAPLISRVPDAKVFPTKSLRFSESTTAPILVVTNEDEHIGQQTLELLIETFPEERFVPFNASTVFNHAWKLVIQLGLAQSSVPGARLGDAWSGGVPVLQMVGPIAVSAYRRRRLGDLAGIVVEHGKTGLLAPTIEELEQALGELLLDALPARAVARGARRRVDPTAEWDALLKTILQ